MYSKLPCFVSKYTEFGFAFYMFAAVPLAPRFWGGGRFNMEQSNIANQRKRDRGPMKFGITAVHGSYERRRHGRLLKVYKT